MKHTVCTRCLNIKESTSIQPVSELDDLVLEAIDVPAHWLNFSGLATPPISDLLHQSFLVFAELHLDISHDLLGQAVVIIAKSLHNFGVVCLDYLHNMPVSFIEVIQYLGHFLDAFVPGFLISGRVDPSLDHGVEIVISVGVWRLGKGDIYGVVDSVGSVIDDGLLAAEPLLLVEGVAQHLLALAGGRGDVVSLHQVPDVASHSRWDLIKFI